MTTSRMPALFLGHGSPMNVLEENRYTQAWRALGEQLPRPKAIVAVSAHWYHSWDGSDGDGTSKNHSRFWRLPAGAV
ncbi:LigB family dioxygenase [Serratia fonticola]|uniref:LigB family dioxygenase n=1 Tax=Serratia fonticola TaxID=47917 RepID=A0A4U9W784_SERFO|nr:LigB family dioxygenase [Serratia fonticola]